jgi:hypothetical protein
LLTGRVYLLNTFSLRFLESTILREWLESNRNYSSRMQITCSFFLNFSALRSSLVPKRWSLSDPIGPRCLLELGTGMLVA